MDTRNLKAVWAWASAAVGLFALMVQSQNCAPAGSGYAGDGLAAGTGEVRIVDDWSKKPLIFPEQMVQLHDETRSFVAHGLCPRKGESKLSWILYDGSRTALSGTIPCEMGGFQVDLHGIDQLKCGSDFVLQVFNHSGEEARTVITRKCPPLMAQESFMNKGSEEVCYLELDRSPYSHEPQCYQACYIGERLAFRESVARNQCGQQIGNI